MSWSFRTVCLIFAPAKSPEGRGLSSGFPPYVMRILAREFHRADKRGDNCQDAKAMRNVRHIEHSQFCSDHDGEGERPNAGDHVVGPQEVRTGMMLHGDLLADVLQSEGTADRHRDEHDREKAGVTA